MTLDPALLRRLLRYEPETGKLFWLPRTPDLFEPTPSHGADRRCLAWNNRLAGKLAFTACNRGYFIGAIFNRRYQGHRVCWAIYYGRWPEGQIDHINGNPSDNRITNLRDVSNLENGRNQRMPKNNTSGFTGVLWDRGRWVARIKVHGRARHLGRFVNRDDAIAARVAAERAEGFHPNHGRARP